jgi:hypothetical protein
MKRLSFLLWAIMIFINGCDDGSTNPNDRIPVPGIDVVTLPVVVHVIHQGQTIGEGPNLSRERIERQIEILNEDFRRKSGTPGFNNHPDGADTRIEFILARRDPAGNPFDGINRVDTTGLDVPFLGYNLNHFAQYAYWDPASYINIWTSPLPISSECLVLGEATGPDTDLPGTDLLLIPGPNDADGILINWIHFGESDIDCHARFGRTLTHEMGHYLGLLHTWGGKICGNNDFCEDTPAVDVVVFGRNSFIGCGGKPIMVENYMNYSEDEVMGVFTNDQVFRMHYVLNNHPGRNALITSKGLMDP